MKKIIALIMVWTFSFGTAASAADIGQNPQTPKAKEGFSLTPTKPNMIEPFHLLYELKPGDKIQDSVTADNFENDPQTFQLYTADATYNDQYFLQFGTKDQPKKFTSKWITLEQNSLPLQANGEAKINFTVQVPSNAGKGNYIAGIALEKEEPSKSNPNIIRASRMVVPVKITVTDNPQHIPKYLEANILSQSPYPWISLIIFAASMAYFVQEKRKEKKE